MMDVIEILDMTLHQLRAFTLVAELGSYKDAAEAFEVSRPCMTFLIKGLEKEYQLKLFNRIRNRTVISSSGEVLLQKAKRVLDDANQLEEEVNKLNGLEKGNLSVGGSGLSTIFGLPLAVLNFKKERPGIDVTLAIDRSRILKKKLLEGDLDFAMLSLDPHSPLLISELYAKEEVVVIVSPDHPLRKERAVSMERLAKEPLIVNKESGLMREEIEARFAKSSISFVPSLELKAYANPRDVIKNAVANRLGIGFLSKCHVVGDVNAGRLKILKVPELQLNRTLYIAFHKNQENSLLIRAFIGFLKQYKNKDRPAVLGRACI